MPLRSKFPDLEIPAVPLHVFQASCWSKFRDNIAIVNADTEESLTYHQVADQVQRVASGLSRLGLHRGDVLSIVSPNNPEYIVLIYGTLTAGGTVNTANPNYTVYELCRQFKDCRPKFICTTQDMVGHIEKAVHQADIYPTLVVLGQAPGWVSYSQLTSDDGSACPDADHLGLDPREDLAFILYSSGTTGIPKGVMLTHYNIVANLLQISSPDLCDPEDPLAPVTQQVCAAYLPFYHISGLTFNINAMMVGGIKLIILSMYSATKLLQIIQDYKVTNLTVVPPVVISIIKHPQLPEYNLSYVKQILCGAAPLDKVTERDFSRKFKAGKVKQAFGMTEASPAVFMHPHWTMRSGSVGMLIPNTETKLVDLTTGKEVGKLERGELWVRGPQVMKGYLNQPKATRETIDKDGWLHTGDVAYFDNDEMFYIVDRIKELIKYKAFQVAPAEMEALLLELPDVADAAVTGVPDYEAGELPSAFVVRQPGSRITAEDIHRFVCERTVYYKQLRGGIHFVDSLPKSAGGKILRRVLKERITKSKM